MKNNKGITLIALVVTIVVLIIISMISIVMLTGNNSILSQAEKAQVETNKADIKEKVQLEVLISYDENGDFKMDILKDNIEKNLGVSREKIQDTEDGGIIFQIEKYTIKVDSQENITIDDNLSGVKPENNIEVGDYVNYSPDSLITTYTSEKTNNGYANQEFTRNNNLSWRILEINKDTGKIKLISDLFWPDSGSEQNGKMTFQGAEGYNNGVLELNNLCNQLYGHSGATVRSVNLEEFKNMNQNIEDVTLADEHNTVPGIYPSEYTGSLGQSEQQNYWNGDITQTYSNIKTTSYYGDIPQNSPLYNSDKYYWLSSRCVTCNEEKNSAYFRLQRADDKLDDGLIFFSTNDVRASNAALRAVVILPDNIKFISTGKDPTKIDEGWNLGW